MRFRDRLLLKHGKSYRFPYGSAVRPPWNSFRRRDSETITQLKNSINEFMGKGKEKTGMTCKERALTGLYTGQELQPGNNCSPKDSHAVSVVNLIEN